MTMAKRHSGKSQEMMGRITDVASSYRLFQSMGATLFALGRSMGDGA
jgi:hypothetical protein